MNQFRSALQNGERPTGPSPVARKEPCRRGTRGERRGADGAAGPAPVSKTDGGTGLLDVLVPRRERRCTDQRREDRLAGLADHAMLTFRRKKLLSRVVNVSGTGVMVECAILPRIGESLAVTFEGFEPIAAVVRWVKNGRIGLDVGEGGIVIGR